MIILHNDGKWFANNPKLGIFVMAVIISLLLVIIGVIFYFVEKTATMCI